MTKPPQNQQEFLQSYDPGQFERPSVAVDVVILTVYERQLYVMLTERHEHPFKELWSLPGGFVGMQESLEQAAQRILWQKGGLEGVYLEQLYTFGAVERDPRMRILSVAYYALVEPSQMGQIAEQAAWLVVGVPWEGTAGGEAQVYDQMGDTRLLAFDHAHILGKAVERIRGKLEYTPIGFELLPQKFTLRQLQEVHQVIWGKKVNKDSFRRKMLASGQLEATGELEQGQDFRPAELYRRKERS